MLILVMGETKESVENINLLFNMCLPPASILTVNQGNECMIVIKERNPNLIIIGSKLTNADCYDTIKQIRHISQVPILALFSSSKEQPFMQAFEAGANLCLDENVSQLEFIAHARALIRGYKKDKKIKKKIPSTRLDPIDRNSQNDPGI